MKYINTNKLKSLNFDKDNLFIILDFDKTITEFDSSDSWDVCGISLGTEVIEQLNDIYQKYRPIEIDYKMDKIEKEKYMIEWNNQCMNLYYEYDLTKEKLETSINKSNIKFRKGVKEFLEKANKYKIPLIILSAGIGNVIKETLEINKCYFDNMYIISNFIEFDMNGNMSKFEGKMIHPLNKSIEGKLPEDIKEKISQKQYGLLVGDLIEDKKMVPEEQLENVITVGFLMNDNNLEVYNQNFDIVLNNEDATFENINDLVLR